MKNLKEHFAKIFTDDKMNKLFVVAIGMIICDIFMFVDSGYKIEPLIRVCYCALFFPMALIFGRKWLPFQYLVIAFSILYFNKWYNPTSFFLVCLVANRYVRFRLILIVLYAMAVLVCLSIGHRNWSHSVLHTLYCFAIYLLVFDVKFDFRKKFYATADEIKIIKQLAEGKKKKEIDGFSQNTVYEKLKNARKRNGVESNDALVELYIQETNNNQ